MARASKLSNLVVEDMARCSPFVSRVDDRTGFESPTLERFESEYLAEYQPHQKQRELHDHIDTRFVAVVAGRRGGKTYGCGREFLRRVYRDVEAKKKTGEKWNRPRVLDDEAKGFCQYWCTSPTYALGNLQRREIFEAIGGVDSPLVLRYQRNKSRLWLAGGVRIEFRSGDRPERLVGDGLDGEWDDESARQKPETWKDSIRPALSDKQGWAIFSSTPMGKNWFYHEVWQKTQHGSGSDRDEDYYGVHFTTADNTSLPHLVEEVRKARRELPRPIFLRNYMASFHAFEGKVFEEFLDDHTHIVEAIPPLVSKWGGVDWGHANPGTQICVGTDRFGNVFVFKEDYARGLTVPPPPANSNADCWVNRLKREGRKGVTHWWADPSEPGDIATCQNYDLRVLGADNAVAPGIDFVASLLKPVVPEANPNGGARPGLYIERSCENLRTELSGYAWGKNGKPVKENDHTVDALRYALYTEATQGTALRRQVDRLRASFPSIFAHAA
jgi:hypothetical protein